MTVILSDMDDTLYPLSMGINMACRKNIEGTCILHSDVIFYGLTEFMMTDYSWFVLIIEYMLNRMHIEESEVPRLCLELYKEHGTTMAGLKV